MTILTAALMYLNYSEKCVPEGIDLKSCFYLKYDIMQCIHVVVMNTILFAHHIETLWTFDKFTTHKTFFRTAVFVHLLLHRPLCLNNCCSEQYSTGHLLEKLASSIYPSFFPSAISTNTSGRVSEARTKAWLAV